MSEYLSKEEIKLWRSSLEKITLEEYAARLGKKIESEKHTNDLIDIVFKGKAVVSDDSNYKQTQAERLSSIAERAFEREQQIAPTPFSVHKITETAEKTEKVEKAEKVEKTAKALKSVKPAKTTKQAAKSLPKATAKKAAPIKSTKTVKAKTTDKKSDIELREEVRVVFKKALTDREQKVFDHFAQNKGKIVYAKELAELLELPKDYVYKYIKNLRAKIDGEKLENADKGGFILNI